MWWLQFCSSFSLLLWLFRVFYKSIQILGFFFYFCEKWHWNFDRNCIDSIDSFENFGHLNNINSSDLWTQEVFLSVFLCLQLLSSETYSFQRRDISPPWLNLFLSMCLLMIFWMGLFHFFVRCFIANIQESKWFLYVYFVSHRFTKGMFRSKSFWRHL